MSTSPVRVEPLAVSVTFGTDTFTAHLNDGRSISVPYVYSPRLAEATPAQRADYELVGRGRGRGIHWPQIDEDLSIAGLLRG
jgi:hypothetical protein